MEDFIGVRLTKREFEVLLRLKDELNARSLSEVMRLSLGYFAQYECDKEDIKELAKQINTERKHELAQEITKSKLRAVSLPLRQINLISALRKQGLKENELQIIISSLNDQLAVLGLDFRHKISKMRVMRYEG